MLMERYTGLRSLHEPHPNLKGLSALLLQKKPAFVDPSDAKQADPVSPGVDRPEAIADANRRIGVFNKNACLRDDIDHQRRKIVKQGEAIVDQKVGDIARLRLP